VIRSIIFSITSIIILLSNPVSGLFQHQSNDEIKVDIINIEELNAIINNRNGKPLLINVWATWCTPCRDEFPDLIRLAKDYDDQIEVVGISADSPEEIDSKVTPFLQQINSSFSNFIIKFNDPEEFINLMNIRWGGAIPATFIYDKYGIQKEFFVGKKNFSDFEKRIKNYLSPTE